jgi:hypothetical protein
MNGETNISETDVPKGRTAPALVATIGAAFLIVDHLTLAHGGSFSLAIVFLAPMFTLLGLGGLVDPRIVWSIGPRGKSLPTGIKVVGACLAMAGIAVSGGLLFSRM